ncbi:lysM and putative peptidoglycan-binding domain-containing protein 1 isoform X3 [Rhincodon typus]|uniref:lysM and putative peptidoglycan-binding domain-containing protein 1 isoform X3 n=1 Tax=Rhincodon typus TaxID=259920 RepID=UPI00202EC04B|nr:lysM and putative peptidoglycan-binding domain-containing protein 1 isoform X3 [Rhincodon typus]
MEAAEGGGAAAECGSLRASARGTSRSYGSTDRGPAAGQRHLEHRPMPGDTLQGLALRYGVSTEQIKRVNRLYTNDSIFLKECLRIPIPKQGPLQNGSTVPDGAPGQSEPALDPLSPELSPMEFLKRLDSKITQSKAGAIRKLSDGAGWMGQWTAVPVPLWLATVTQSGPRHHDTPQRRGHAWVPCA